MNCPQCNSNKSCVVNSRKDENTVYRRRKCSVCGYSWYTKEIISESAKKLLGIIERKNKKRAVIEKAVMKYQKNQK